MRITKNIDCEVSKKNWEMMNFKRLALWLSLGGMVASVSSCDVDDTTVESFGLGDVFIESMMDGDNLVHRPVYFAYSDYYKIMSAKVTSENTDAVELESYLNYNTTFANKDADFSADLPTAEDYDFTIEFANGDEKVVTDSLEEDFIAPPVIDEIDASIAGKMRIEWITVDDDELDAYSIRMFDEDDELIYSTPLLTPDDDDFTIKGDDNYWLDRGFLSGDVKVKVSAYRFEDGVEGTTGYYHYQAVGVTYQDATWTAAE